MVDVDNPCAFRDCEHLFLKLEDLSVNPSGDTPGFSIDAVTLIKPDGAEYFAQEVVSSDIRCEFNSACDPLKTLGAPDRSECFEGPVGEHVVALNGGELVVHFKDLSGAIVPVKEDDIVFIPVLECGGCLSDRHAKVSVGKEATGLFVDIGEGGDCRSTSLRVGALP